MREYATQIGYYAPDRKCERCGKVFEIKQRHQHFCPECARFMKEKVWRHGTNKKFYYDGCFHTRTEERERMRQLRDEGYSNKEIAQKLGRDYRTVLHALGYQPEGITKKNKQIGQKIRAQKSASRKQYVVNEQVTAYNRKIDECKKKRAELAELKVLVGNMEQTIRKDEKRVARLANKVIKCPDMELHTVQMSAL